MRFNSQYFFPEPLVKNGQVIDLTELVGMMPVTLMLNIFFGNKFISLHQEQIEKLTKDSHFIMTTVFYNRNATTAVYKYFDTDANRYLCSMLLFSFLCIIPIHTPFFFVLIALFLIVNYL